ncbi:hypothetical protein FGO68_gene12620 [Halteria grandinella]|uniref:Uncharacterized protein n=1 Tax=Halteria grandinella TaxID=5974 RepID=A0A8J8NA65_HALGN|nr:hypothetical protein FGO68_gene12620 [Halteria grandinella]
MDIHKQIFHHETEKFQEKTNSITFIMQYPNYEFKPSDNVYIKRKKPQMHKNYFKTCKYIEQASRGCLNDNIFKLLHFHYLQGLAHFKIILEFMERIEDHTKRVIRVCNSRIPSNEKNTYSIIQLILSNK